MQRDYGIIKYIILIIFAILLFTQASLAQGLLRPSGRLKWESKYNRYSDGSTNLSVYGDYKLNFVGSLGNYKIGTYNLDFSYKDYLKTDVKQPTQTTYNLNTSLFPQSSFALNLGAGKNETEYKGENMEDAVDTITNHSSVAFNTPLPFGIRFGYNLNNSHQYDKQKNKVDDERNNWSMRLNKNMRFGSFMTSSLSTRYMETITEDLIKGTKNQDETKSLNWNNSFLTKPFSLTDLDARYSLSDDEGEQIITYNLLAQWKPLDNLSLRTSQGEKVIKEKVGDHFNTTDSTVTSNVNFSAKPYSILSFNGGLENAVSESGGLLDSRSLSGNFGFQLSFWDDIPLNFNLSKKTVKEFDENEDEDSRYESNSLNLSTNLHFGNFTINPGYRQNSSQNIETNGEDSEVDNRNLNVGVSYRKNLTRKLSFTGQTQLNSDLETFDYDPNYDLDLRYQLASNLRLKLGVNGRHQDEEEDAQGTTIQSAKDYRNWNGSLSYSRRQLRLRLDVKQNNDFLNDEKDTTVMIDSTYYYRAVELNMDAKWKPEENNNLTVTTSVTRRF